MTKNVSVAEAKAKLSELMTEAARGGQRVVISKRGKPIAALVSVDDLELIETSSPRTDRPQGALALVGAWRDLSDGEMDSLVEDIYEARARDAGRSVDLSN